MACMALSVENSFSCLHPIVGFIYPTDLISWGVLFYVFFTPSRLGSLEGRVEFYLLLTSITVTVYISSFSCPSRTFQ